MVYAMASMPSVTVVPIVSIMSVVGCVMLDMFLVTFLTHIMFSMSLMAVGMFAGCVTGMRIRMVLPMRGGLLAVFMARVIAI